MSNNEPCDDEVVIVTVCLDHHIGSTLLTNFYRTIKFKKLNSNIIINNNIEISNELIYHTNHNTKLIPVPQLLYRGSRDGFKSIDFHSKCDNQGPTLTIIKSAEFNQIFGGFTTKNWKSSPNGKYISDDLAFIFKIEENSSSNRQQQLFRKFNIRPFRALYAIYAHEEYLPVFGGGFDFSIYNDCNLNDESSSAVGFSYELPPPSNSNEYLESENAINYLAGSEYFKVSEIEVFKISTTIQ